MPKIRGCDRERQAAVAQERQRGATACLRLAAAAERSYSTFKVRKLSCEEKPFVQRKEQQLRFAAAAEKTYTTSKVAET